VSVDTDYWDVPYFPGMGGSVDPDTPVITFPVNGLTVPPVHNITGTAKPGQTVALWSAMNGGTLAEHATTTADDQGRFTFTGEQITGRDGDVATFEVRTDTGTSSDVVVTVRGPVVTGILPASITADAPGAFILQGERFLTMTRLMQVLVIEADGTTKFRVDPDSITATEVRFTATLTQEGTATIELAEGDAGPRMSDPVSVTVTAAPAPEAIGPGDVTEATHDAETVTADPATAWAPGESALFGDGEFHWDGAAWVAGAVPEPEPAP
jgi:hypothetical protein